MQKNYCDKCEKETEKVKLTRVALTYGRNSYNQTCIQKEFCDECLESLGLKRPADREPIPSQSIGDKLYDIITEIAQECLDNQ